MASPFGGGMPKGGGGAAGSGKATEYVDPEFAAALAAAFPKWKASKVNYWAGHYGRHVVRRSDLIAKGRNVKVLDFDAFRKFRLQRRREHDREGGFFSSGAGLLSTALLFPAGGAFAGAFGGSAGSYGAASSLGGSSSYLSSGPSLGFYAGSPNKQKAIEGNVKSLGKAAAALGAGSALGSAVGFDFAGLIGKLKGLFQGPPETSGGGGFGTGGNYPEETTVPVQAGFGGVGVLIVAAGAAYFLLKGR
jgi:hypothetical protein